MYRVINSAGTLENVFFFLNFERHKTNWVQLHSIRVEEMSAILNLQIKLSAGLPTCTGKWNAFFWEWYLGELTF